MYSTHRRRHVRAGFGAVEEVLKVGLQVDLVFVRGLSVHADGPVSACPSMGCEHPFDVDVMRKFVKDISGQFLASSAIRCCFVYTNSGLGVPGMFPSSGS